MLDSTINLNVDTTNDDTPEVIGITRYDEYRDRSVYIFPAHTLEKRDMLGISRILPKKSGNFRGVARAGAKITLDVEVPGVDATTSYVQPLIADVTFAIPVGTDTVTVKEVRQRIIAFLDDDTVMDRLMDKLEI